MSDGSVWEIPGEIIASARARFYATRVYAAGDSWGDEDEEYEIHFRAEMDFVLREDDGFQLADWAANNMNWDDVRKHAVMVQGPKPLNFEDEWLHCDKKAVDRPDAKEGWTP